MFPIVGGMGVNPPILRFFSKPPIKTYPPQWGAPPLKNEAPPVPFEKKTPPPPLKSEALFQEMIPGKKPEKSETVINTCVLIINAIEKDARNSTRT